QRGNRVGDWLLAVENRKRVESVSALQVLGIKAVDDVQIQLVEQALTFAPVAGNQQILAIMLVHAHAESLRCTGRRYLRPRLIEQNAELEGVFLRGKKLDFAQVVKLGSVIAPKVLHRWCQPEHGADCRARCLEPDFVAQAVWIFAEGAAGAEVGAA